MTNRPTESKDPERRDVRGDHQIFLCDASAEAGRLLTALQAKGYSVVDVPLGLMLSRCRYESPEVLICDADAHEAETKLSELSALGIKKLKLILLGQKDGALDRSIKLGELAHYSFVRPIEIEHLVIHIASLCSQPRRRSNRPRVGRPGLMPSLVASARKPYRSDAGFFDSSPYGFEREEPSDTAWPIEPSLSRGPRLSDAPPIETESRGSLRPSATGAFSPSHLKVSAETASVLEQGRRRLDSYPKQTARPVRLTVAQSVACDLRPGLLAALQEPLSDMDFGIRSDDDYPESTSPGTRGPATGRHQREISELDSAPPASILTGSTNSRNKSAIPVSEPSEETNPGGRPGGTQPPPELQGLDLQMSSDLPAPSMEDLSDLLSPPWSEPPADLSEEPKADLNTTQPPRRPQNQRSQAVDLESINDGPDLEGSEFFGAPSVPASLFAHIHEQALPSLAEPRSGRTPLAHTPGHRDLQVQSAQSPATLSILLAHAICERRSGAIAQQDKGGIRRVLLTDGDVSSAVSAIPTESLSHFLHVRGDVTESALATLSAIPAFGRHAGAALIARGLLQQEDLWPILRAHAEWILGLALVSSAPAVLEENVPQRLLDEPAVFGGAAGAEVYLEGVRRVITPEIALNNLGGNERILGRGSHETLMGETALSPHDQQAILQSIGHPLGPLMKQGAHLLPILLGLVRLGVLTAGGELVVPPGEIQARSSEIDQQAFVARLMARRALVDDGDYFAILGVTRSATSYEVSRARDELLALYSEDQLTPRTLHLREDMELLRATIEEAHLVLYDDVRRSRYRRALEAVPS